jgi:hypothetical protein
MAKTKYLTFIFCFILLSSFVLASSAYGEEIERDGYSVSRSKVERTIVVGTLFEDFITVENFRNEPISATFSASGNAMDLLEFDSSGIFI